MTWTSKALVLGLDGVRYDTLRSTPLPRLEALAAGGFVLPSPLYPGRVAATVSGVGWSSVATGVWPEKHGVADNTLAGNDLASYDDFLARLADAGRRTFAGLGWGPLGSIFRDRGHARELRDGGTHGFAAADVRVLDAACRQLREGDVDAAFVYLGGVDECGHQAGTGAEYTKALRLVDDQVGALLDAVAARATYGNERWLVIAVTDHGHVDGGGHGGQSEVERTSWVMAGGAGVRAPARTVHVVDVAPTVLEHLGVPLEPGWGLDGRSFLGG